MQQAPVVQKMDNTIHWIYLYPVDNAIVCSDTNPRIVINPMIKRYPMFEQPGPADQCNKNYTQSAKRKVVVVRVTCSRN